MNRLSIGFSQLFDIFRIDLFKKNIEYISLKMKILFSKKERNMSSVERRKKTIGGEAKRIEKMRSEEIREYVYDHPLRLLLKLKNYFDILYYNTGASTLSDAKYDVFKETIKERYPEIDLGVGAALREEDNRVKLPYWLGSSTKITSNDVGRFQRWIDRYPSSKYNYIVSDKLDGVSCLLCSDGKQISLYTRGNGEIGANISYLEEYFQNIPFNIPAMCVRGELIIEKKIFESKYRSKMVNGRIYKNGRNMVSGLIGSKTSREGLKDIHFVAYELVEDIGHPQLQQFRTLDKLGFEVVNYEVFPNLSIDILEKTLLRFKNESKYEIDGIIIQIDAEYKRNTSGNPDYMFAFKMLLSDDIHDTRVERVEWRTSKRGYLTPVVVFNTVYTEDAELKRATGFNARYIVDNGVGEGALISVTRSNGVIPYILEVKEPVEVNLPSYVWDENGVNIISQEEDIVEKKCKKLIEEFFKKLGIKRVAEKTINRLFDNGFDSMAKIALADEYDLMRVPGIQNKTAEMIHKNVIEGLKHANLSLVLGSSGILGFGIGERKTKALLEAIPTLLEEKVDRNLLRRIKNVYGFSDITANKVFSNLKGAKDLIKRLMKKNLITFNMKGERTDIEEKKKEEILKKKRESSKLIRKTVVMSGFRDTDLKRRIEGMGGKVTTSVSGNTDILITNDPNSTTSKVRKARENNVEILIPREFKEKYEIT